MSDDPLQPPESGSEPPPEAEFPSLPPELPPEEPATFWSYADLGVFAGAAVPCLLLGYAIVKAFFWLLPWKPASDAVVLIPAQALGYGLLFGVLFAMFRMYGRPFWRSLGWVETSVGPIALVAAGWGTAITIVLLGTLIRTPNSENELTKLMKDPVSLGIMVVFGTTVAPLSEELAFRGFLQPLLVRSLGAIPGIVCASIPFGLLHFREYGNSWRHALLISIAGAAFGVMRHVTGSTRAAALMHASYNALFFAAFLAAGSALR
jgi:membrane protease YdiL (CAAX protease family)